ncbi:MAG TPA: hypothetical protein VFX43_15845 [Chitinophagaceae bacterium]|nr:hypothetical protein [Chitinophagaceae bacterium]
MTDREIVDLVKEWKDEVKSLVGDYNKIVSRITDATDIVKGSEKKWYIEFKWLIILVTLFIIVVGLMVTMNDTHVCKVSINPQANTGFIERCKK